MKTPIKLLPAAISAAMVAFGTFALNANANQITGSIGFGDTGVTINSSDLASASAFGLSAPFVTTDTGMYAGIPTLTSVDFTGFQFNPPVGSVTPLWTFTIGSVTYSFDATTVASFFDPVLRQWDIGGSGMAFITGYTPTPGTWTVNLSQSGATVAFDATSAATPTVPDGGSSMALLGGALIALVTLPRKFGC